MNQTNNLKNLASKLFPQYWGDYALSILSPEGLEEVRRKKEAFKKNPPPIRMTPYWGERRFRQEFVYGRYEPYLKGLVLDVGCDKAALRSLIGKGYVGIDRQGDFDVQVDLSRHYLPFRDNAFDAVICTDVLEHANDVYTLFDELIRVTKRYVIISLPNCWWEHLWSFKKGMDTSRSYGLPPEPALDRHQWFFNCVQAEDYIAYRSAKSGAKIISWEHFYRRGEILRVPFRLGGKELAYPANYPAPDGVRNAKRLALRAFYWPFEGYEKTVRFFSRLFSDDEKFRNRHVAVVWALIEKNPAH